MTTAQTQYNTAGLALITKGVGQNIFQDRTDSTPKNLLVLGDTLNTQGNPVASGGTKFTISGCSVSSSTGGSAAGTYTSGTNGVCTVTVTLNGATGSTAPNGWACSLNDQTTPADVQHQTASTATTATFSGTTTSGDVVNFSCTGY